ncbi:MAG: S8 family serine peptidase [Lachnospiraceae bacterium]|nr:S8 family serine peptidase [Lachnospiraceae bacterium]
MGFVIKIKRKLAGVMMVSLLLGDMPLFAAAEDVGGDAFPEESISGNAETVPEEEAAEDGTEDLLPEEEPYGDTDELPAEEAAEEEAAEQTEDLSSLLDGLSCGEDYAAGELVALVKDTQEAGYLAAYFDAEIKKLEYGVLVLDLKDGDAEEALKRVPEGFCVGPNMRYEIGNEDRVTASVSEKEALEEPLPRETDWSSWYGSGSDGDSLLQPWSEDYQWMHDPVNTYAAWSVTTGSSDLNVAVLGSGVDASQRDFADKKGKNVRITAESVLEYPEGDADGSGTHAAGIIGAGLRNSRAAAGIAPEVSILGIRILDEEGVLTSASFCAGLLSLLNEDGSRRADIADLAVFCGDRYVPEEAEAVSRLRAAGVTMLAGAGDDGSNALKYPAAYTGVISVGALDRDLERAAFSDYGSGVLIYAPGVDISSTEPKNRYAKRSSTHAAAAVAAGVAALYMSAEGYYPPLEMEQILAGCASDGCMDAAEIFKSDRTAPELTIRDGLGRYIASVSAGSVLKPEFTFSGDCTVTAEAKNYRGHSENCTLIYSDNGKYPAVKEGLIVNGQLYTEPLLLSSLCDGEKIQKVRLSVAAVTPIGVLGESSGMVLSVDPGRVSEEAFIRITNAPAQIPLGSSIRLMAEAEGTIASALRWRVTDEGGLLTELNAETGELCVLGDRDGIVSVQCYAEYPIPVESEIVSIEVKQGRVWVDSIALNSSAGTIGYSASAETPDSYELRVVELKDQRGANVLTDENVALVWSSSNGNAAVVEVSENGRKATVIPKGKGDADIICSVMDGSGKSAVFRCTVEQLVEEIRIAGPICLLAGKSYKYRADALLPGDVKNKKLRWELKDAPSWASIDAKSGKLRLSKDAPLGGRLQLRATSLDKGGASAELQLRVIGYKAERMVLTTGRNDSFLKLSLDKKSGSINSFTLYTKRVSMVKPDTTSLIVMSRVFLNDEQINMPLSFKSSNEKVVTVTPLASGQGVTIKAVGKGKAYVTCTVADAGGLKRKIRVTVAEPVESLQISGQSVIPLGGKAGYKASAILPKNASKRSVRYALAGEDLSGVSITKKGLVKVGKNAVVGAQVTVVAYAKDECGAMARCSFIISEKKTAEIKISSNTVGNNFDIRKDKKGSICSLRLFMQNAVNSIGDESTIRLLSNAPGALSWSSSDPQIVEVKPAADGRSATISARGEGEAVVKVKSIDGTRQSAEIAVKVDIPASGLSLVAEDEQSGPYHYLAYGQSVQTSAVIGDSYGRATDRGVKWSCEILDVSPERDKEGVITDWKLSVNPKSEELLGLPDLFRFSGGKLTMPSMEALQEQKAWFSGSEVNEYICGIRVSAVTRDGSGEKAQIVYIAVPAAEKLWLCNTDGSLADTGALTVKAGGESVEYLLTEQTGTSQGRTVLLAGARVESSDPHVLSAYYDRERSCLVVTGHQPGRERITVTACDGTGIRMQLEFTVNPI